MGNCLGDGVGNNGGTRLTAETPQVTNMPLLHGDLVTVGRIAVVDRTW